MNGNGYSAVEKPLVSVFTPEQRQRVEALTLSLALWGKSHPLHVHITFAEYVCTGKTD